MIKRWREGGRGGGTRLFHVLTAVNNDGEGGTGGRGVGCSYRAPLSLSHSRIHRIHTELDKLFD